MADTSTGDHTDFDKMKVADLRKLLKARGLSVVGNKQELVERLQNSDSDAAAEALLEGSEAGDIIDEELERELDETPLDEEAVKGLDDPLKDEEKPLPAKVESKGSADISTTAEQQKDVKPEEKDKLNGSGKNDKPPTEKHKRITITDLTVVDAAARKKARLERFNQTTTTTTANPTTTSKPVASENNSVAPAAVKADGSSLSDKMKKRAERFGILSPAEAKKQQLEKLQARKNRFSSGVVPAPVSAAKTEGKTSLPPIPAIKTASSIEEKKQLRAQRFKIKI
ncbi:SAP domain [Nesidiocoris tenuis]|uniref:SAP domain n=1 Tax=Nesidiocoris tenuis TaxID=355587 RepID=A0ABN7B7Y5_9HEMI|nr:SAP domain [Nesidiocoris tenuis]